MSLNKWSPDNYIRAYKFAAHAHRGQTIPGADISYLMHLSFVCMEVIAALDVEPGHHDNLAVQCALLHDIIEDTTVTFEQVEAEFGAAVAQGVLALTKDKMLSKELQMADSLRRIKQQPAEVWMVKLADRITNLQPPPHYWTPEKIVRYRAEAIEIYTALAEASPHLSSRLLEKIEDYKMLCG